jgi:hypothetical protein
MKCGGVRLINLSKIIDKRGSLSVIEEGKDFPFKIERCCWIYDVPGGDSLGGKAFRNNTEFIVSLSGSFDVVIDNGNKIMKYTLNRSFHGLLVPNLVWYEINNFSTNSLALILSSSNYDNSDCIIDYQYFKNLNYEV